MEAHIFLLQLIRSLVIIVFALSSWSKLNNFQGFEQSISSFQVVAPRFSKVIAILLLIAEVSIVMCLIGGGLLTIFGFVIAIVSLFLFSSILAISLLSKRKVNCNCFGQSKKYITIFDVYRNIALIILSILGIYLALIYVDSEITVLEFILILALSLNIAAVLVNLSEISELFVTAREKELF